MANLPGYECQLGECGVAHSAAKLAAAAAGLASAADVPPSVVTALPCTSHDETVGYRSTCGFQVLRGEGVDGAVRHVYAMRNNYRPELIESDVFPVAVPRIQAAMAALLRVLDADANGTNQAYISNETNQTDGANRTKQSGGTNQTGGSDGTIQTGGSDGFSRNNGAVVTVALRTVTFVSAWDERDCFLTMCYDAPPGDQSGG